MAIWVMWEFLDYIRYRILAEVQFLSAVPTPDNSFVCLNSLSLLLHASVIVEE